MSERDTICALASGQPPAAICIIRLSGDRIWKLAGALLDCGLPEPRRATLTRFRDEDGHLIDEGIVVFMPGPHSYTGEDTLELYLHGGPAVINHAISTLTREPGVRLAEPGEFTRRAFEAGKIDLTEAEGVADIIEAETNAQKAQALRQLSGGLTQQYDQWRAELTGILALIEVAVDFPDEDDAPEETTAPVLRKLGALISDMEAALGDRGIGEKIRDGFRIAIIGAPNAGKSTLLNRLAGREAAIVTSLPGTTRDVIEIRRVMGGQIVWISDTAGLRETEDEIEAEGVRRAQKVAAEADLRVFMVDGSAPDPGVLTSPYRLPTDMVVVNKADADLAENLPAHDFRISAKTGDGVETLERALSEFISARAASVEAPVITRARHRARLVEGLACLVAARDALELGTGAELAAEDVRMAIRHLGSVIGVVGVEDVLGAVFSEFCIGK
ncbi:tRNA uridine-5-carboxymethylaminomethyl(34) synthesis GTPase MnmE [Hyphomonas sp.]|uniref:tRNA uridine-5-carboxymethylaminomethyl(34) synthesis GTPase MnmE n=1 Tax=Hyphomonas sp. TaxID=87 RepID=UPI0025C54C54|nr:tRNA uridine-5-carboxymethylaminomethyl(34) synthesis GTPase MnmE [Hyphomonas sp.]